MDSNKQNNNLGYAPTSYYPYGELPLKYTKQGQAQLRQNVKDGQTNAFTKPVINEPVEQTISTTTKTTDAVSKPNENNFNGFNLNGNLDFNTVLPLLNNFGGGKNDMIGKLIPLINGNGNLQINDLLKLFTGLSKTKTASTKTEAFSSDSIIDTLQKVD